LLNPNDQHRQDLADVKAKLTPANDAARESKKAYDQNRLVVAGLKAEVSRLEKLLAREKLEIGSKWAWETHYGGKNTVTVVYVDETHIIFLEASKTPRRVDINTFFERCTYRSAS